MESSNWKQALETFLAHGVEQLHFPYSTAWFGESITMLFHLFDIWSRDKVSGGV